MEVASYLDRIGLDPAWRPAATINDIDRLQQAHVTRVPFENLSIVGSTGENGGPGISLSIPALTEKIVDERRGGLCFELNGTFAALLEELGFEVRRLAGRVFTGDDGTLGPLESHLTILITLEKPYIVDIGFGDIIRRPMALDGTVTETVDGDWRVVESDRSDATHEVQFRPPATDRWMPRYVFRDTPRTLSSFETAKEYHESDPDAPFTGDPIVSIAHETGQKTLSPRSLTVTANGEKRKQSVEPDEWPTVLEREFGVALDR